MARDKDKIILRGMEFFGYHGVLPAERELGQRFVVDVELACDLEAAGSSDDLSKSVDYSEVFELVAQIVTGEPYRLIESVAERIAQEILRRFAVDEVLVRVKKPQAPLKGVFSWVGVEITRRRRKQDER
ncbi:MAG: dihydroneopterin aldolase [Thermacetogeniaceae bacterium]